MKERKWQIGAKKHGASRRAKKLAELAAQADARNASGEAPETPYEPPKRSARRQARTIEILAKGFSNLAKDAPLAAVGRKFTAGRKSRSDGPLKRLVVPGGG